MYKREQRGLLAAVAVAAVITALLGYADRRGDRPDCDDVTAGLAANEAMADSIARKHAGMADESSRRRDTVRRRQRSRPHHTMRHSAPPRNPLDDIVPPHDN